MTISSHLHHMLIHQKPQISQTVDGTRYAIIGDTSTLYNCSVWEVLVQRPGCAEELRVLLVSPNMDENIHFLSALESKQEERTSIWRFLVYALNTLGPISDELHCTQKGFWHVGWDFLAKRPYVRIVG